MQAASTPNRELTDFVETSRFLSESSEHDPWAPHVDALLLRRWLADVQIALQSGTPGDWEMAGPAVAIEYPDTGALEAILRLVSSEAGIRLAKVPDGGLKELLPKMRKGFEQLAPVIVILSEEDINSSFSSVFEPSMRAFAQDAMGPFNPNAPVLIALATKSLADIDGHLLGVDLFNRQIRLEPPDNQVLAMQFFDLLGPTIVSDELTGNARKVGMLVRDHCKTMDLTRLLALHLRRIARRHARPLFFSDIVDLILRGPIEHNDRLRREPSEAYRRKVACHEAGHVCVAIVDSQGCAVPEYASITPSADFAGIIMTSLHHYYESEEFTFKHLLLRIRTLLAGRAAEEMFFGSLNVSNGPDNDLAKATTLSYNLFSRSGFHPSMASNGVSGMNLAVQKGSDIDPVQNDRITREVRTFLSEQYAHVIRVLEENRVFVEAVIDRLMWDPVVDQDEIAELARLHGFRIELDGRPALYDWRPTGPPDPNVDPPAPPEPGLH